MGSYRPKMPSPGPWVVCACLLFVVSACSSPRTSSSPVQATTRADGEPLAWTPTGEKMQEGCQEAADVLAFSVPCPTVLPGERAGDIGCSTVDVPSDETTVRRQGCVWGEGFHLVPSVPGGEVTHVVIEGGRSRNSDCDGTEFDNFSFGDAEVTLYECSELGGLHAHHVLAQWEVEGVWYGASSHVGQDQALHEEIVTVIVDGIELVPPA